MPQKKELAEEILYAQYKKSMVSNYIIMPDWEELSEIEKTAWLSVADFLIENVIE